MTPHSDPLPLTLLGIWFAIVFVAVAWPIGRTKLKKKDANGRKSNRSKRTEKSPTDPP